VTFIVLWLFCGIISAIIANSRGRSGCAWFLLGILLGPFGFAVALLPSVKTSDWTKKCPKCAENVKLEAQICRYCGYEFRPSSEDINDSLNKLQKSIKNIETTVKRIDKIETERNNLK
jgi:hypothetical protein